jgi:AcrR family transcriptional regulator
MPSPAARGLRQRKKERIREQLTDVALRLFTVRGFDRTTVESIVEEVGVSPRTFFRYFPAKEDVLTASAERLGVDLRAALAARPPDEAPLASLRRVLTERARVYDADRASYLALSRMIDGTPALRARYRDKQQTWERGFVEEIAVRLGLRGDRHRLGPRVLARVAGAAFGAAVDTWVAGGGRPRLAQLVDESFAIIERGLQGRTAGRVRR